MFPVGPVANILSVSPSLGKESSLICHCDCHTLLRSAVLNNVLPWGCSPAAIVFSDLHLQYLLSPESDLQ